MCSPFCPTGDPLRAAAGAGLRASAAPSRDLPNYHLHQPVCTECTQTEVNSPPSVRHANADRAHLVAHHADITFTGEQCSPSTIYVLFDCCCNPGRIFHCD